MSVPAQRPARARSAEEKYQRREDILRAAERLWTTTPYAELSMNQVAREAQLAKGTLYLYFDTKEDLFLALLSEHLRAWLHDLTSELDKSSPQTPDDVADVLLATSRDLEPLRRLLVLLGTVLERNARPELVASFKQEMQTLTEGVAQRLPFAPEVTLRLLHHLHALSIGWQQLTEDASRSGVDNPFEEEFRLALRAVVRAVAQS
ncbi:TetR/AcrR family transcriptional regulator [Deinococcus deserti]|uniref:Putative transcriptional regulator, TetR family n=1 Tax=Deinococcus deserti (strain DSM 17065 / CIP 109153 / LMG 22923 / VCD115) TaxID=546414 RepID=C1CUF8_DEIDV|nr:TetR/AcrR family transcriptional regulator [Deinococcus deserti]ACO45825.1 putative transcriptional regulator, TetR family [Deinococcus deserti VCD115]